MAYLTKSLVMPNGEYVFVGKHWYGTCSTAAATQNKTVSITGFNSAELVEGVQVTVCFVNIQLYSGQPKLNVSNTGARAIVRRGYSSTSYENADFCEWYNGEVLTFIYSGNFWIIDNGAHASLSAYGKTKLSEIITDDASVALTPKAVYDAGYVNASGAAAAAPVQSVNRQTGEVVLDAEDVGALPDSTVIPTKTSDLTNDSNFITASQAPVQSVNGQTGAVSLTIPTVPTNVSAFNNDAGYITSAALPTKVSDLTNDSGYLTLATLPIWDGGVI